ncbi:MAG TPA: class I SAM-dependent rRNA methyltransferase [Bacteroidetes bacterium]|nr:class I SAM-dependent rRNA methyltransferase [Bacteroidota bacterium]
MIKIYLKPKKEQAIQRRHPWIFSGAIRNIEGEAGDGDAVEVYSSKNEFLAVGHFHEGSIAVRILSYKKRKLDAEFWRSQIKKAAVYRQFLGFPSEATNCYRMVHGEGDGLSGLVVDIYGNTAVLQCHTVGMHREREAIAQAVKDIVEGVEAVFDKSRASLPERYANTIENSYLTGNSAPQNVLENGHRFYVDWERGQKTGFFLDQRDNRQMLSKYAKRKKVLNAFCYSGGFSVYAMQAGAAEVHSIDVSKKAMDWTDKNIELNPTDCLHESIQGKVLDYLKDTEPYEVMVVDPPAFAKRISKRHNAVQGYKRLNAMAMQKMLPGGVLFTFSCSQVIDRQLFYNTIVAAAIEAGRSVKVMHHLSQPADHPVNLFHPEGAYLKGLVLRIE